MNTNYPDDFIDNLVAQSLAGQLEPVSETDAAEFLREYPEPSSDSELLRNLPERYEELKEDRKKENLMSALSLPAVFAMNRGNQNDEFSCETEEELAKARARALETCSDAEFGTPQSSALVSTDVEGQAAKLANECNLTSLPVDIFGIARNETDIVLQPIRTEDESFSGRIEFHGQINKFLLFFPEHPLAEQTGRLRFSIAHELGHYFIPSHREILLSGSFHHSNAGFVCDNRMEREADSFAAALLMPEDPFKRRFRDRGFLTLEEIVKTADEILVSREAFAIRYAKTTEEACSVIVSSGRKVLYCASSDEASYNRFRLRRNDCLPSEILPTRSNPMVKAEIDCKTLFPDAYEETSVWSESVNLGYDDRVLSIVSLDF